MSCSFSLTYAVFQQSIAVLSWIQDPAATMWRSGTTMPQLMPVLSSGLEAVSETATSLRPKRAAEKPVSRSNMQTNTHFLHSMETVWIV